MPRLRLKYGTSLFFILEILYPLTFTVPELGKVSRNNKRIKVDLPAPLGPTIKTNSPLLIVILTSSKAKASFSYFLETCSIVIIGCVIIKLLLPNIV